MPATQHKPCIRCHACGRKHWDQKRADQCRGKAIRKAQRAGYPHPQPVGGVYLSPQQMQLYQQQQQQMALYEQQLQQTYLQQQAEMYMSQQPQMYMPQQQQPQQVQQQQPQQQQQVGEIFYNNGFGLPSFQPPYSPQESHHGQSPMPQLQQQQLDLQQLQQQQMRELFGFDLPQESLVDPSLIPQTPPPTPPAAVAAAQPQPPQQPHQQASHDPAVEASLMQFINTLDDAELARSIAVLDDWQAGNAVAGNFGVNGLGYDGQV